MSNLAIPATSVRLPLEARQALARHQAVDVTSHGIVTYCILHPEEYDAVSAILERRRQGLPVRVEDLLDDDDFAELAEQAAADTGMDAGMLESWL